MVLKRPRAANVAQTSETMSVAVNARGILNVPMSALGKVRPKYQKKGLKQKMPKIDTLDALQDDLKNKSEKTQFLGKIETPA